MSRSQREQTQRRAQISHIKARLDPSEVEALPAELCVSLGFCLPRVEIARFVAAPPEDSDEFTEAVLVAEGYGLPTQDPVVDQARELVALAFIRHQSPDS